MLNDAQTAAVNSTGELVVVRAPAGSGKTRILVARAMREIEEGRNPIIITFTRAAAREVEGRIENHSGLRYCGTLHGLAFDLLREYPQHLPEGLVRGAGGEWGVAGATVAHVADHMRKITGTDPRSQLHMSGLVSYDELLVYAIAILESASEMGVLSTVLGCDAVLVDEAQDLTYLEWKFVRLLCPRRFIVGDAAQAIYGWRGGQVGEFLKEYMAADAKVDLEVNYRSDSDIIAAANRLQVKGKVTMRGTKEKTSAAPSLWTLSPSAAVETIRLAQGTKKTCVVVARTRRSANDASVALGRSQIMHRAPIQYADVWTSAGGSIVAAAAHLLANPFDDLHLAYLLSKSGLDDGTILRIEAERATSMKPLWTFLSAGGEGMLGYWLPTFQVFIDSVALHRRGFIAASISSLTPELERTPPWCASLCRIVEAVLHAEIPPEYILRPLLIQDMRLRQGCMALEVANAWCDHPMSPADGGPAEFLSWLADPHTSESALLSEGEDGQGPNILVTTIHGAKGGEWDRVVLWDCVEGSMPTHGDTREERTLDEARRLFYVATTRAIKDVVYVIGDDDDHKRPSRFLREAGVA